MGPETGKESPTPLNCVRRAGSSGECSSGETELGIGQLPGQSSRCFHLRQTDGGRADFKLLSFLQVPVGTKQQSRLKYSHSLMSIPFHPQSQHSSRRRAARSTRDRHQTPRQSYFHSTVSAHASKEKRRIHVSTRTLGSPASQCQVRKG